MNESVEPNKPRRRKKSNAAGRKKSSTPKGPPAEAELRDPHFADHFPEDPELSVLVAAFEAGDYARVRREAPLLAKKTDDEAIRNAARQLRRRIDPEPVTVYLLVAAMALLAFLSIWYWTNHPHAH